MMPYRDPISGMTFYTKHEVDTIVGGNTFASQQDKPESVLVASWTSDSGRYYYDLAHGKIRPVFVKAYDTHTGQVFPLSEEQIISGDLNTTRIWLDSDPGASRIMLYYF